ncbi:MAG: serine/threonine protein kinase [Deltaproteobacteria bacterium]|nr:serine/threonine protein kinase [Deltaproteobacteria bacterium]
MDLDDNASTAVDAAAETGEATAIQRSFIAGHMRRTRWMIGLILGIAGMATSAMLVVGGSPVGRACLAVGVVLAVGSALALTRLTADPSRFPHAAGVVAWITLALGISIGGAYFGVLSGAVAAHVITITFVTMAHESRVGLWTTLAAMGSTAALGGAIASGAMADPGVIRIDGLSTTQQLVLLAAELALIAAAHLVAVVSRRATGAAVAELDAAIRSVSRREALLEEARVELAHPRRVGQLGRFSDQQLGAFRLGTVLGRGGMGEVYDAVHVDTGTPAAVKVLRREALGDARARIRFEREAQLLIQLRHPHVVKVFQVGDRDAALPFIAMERLDGRDLAALLREAPPFSRERAIHLLTQVGRGLDAAHAHGVIHRDIKPQNLVWQPGPAGGTWTIIDFGAARGVDDGGTLTAGNLIGTPAYMAPEQAVHGRADARADRYALGVVAFRVLTGELPHRGQDRLVLLQRIATEPARAPTSVEPSLPDELDAVFAIALARDPDERFASCAELTAAIVAALDQQLPPRLAARGLALLHRTRASRPPGRA